MLRSVSWLNLITIALSWGLATACAPKNSKKTDEKTYIKECILPEEQQFSLQGKWSATPIKFAFKNGDWSGSDIAAVQAGATTWNNFFNASKGFSIFDAGPSGAGYSSSLSQVAPNCAAATVGDGVVLYKRQSSWTKSATAVAVTTTCYSSGSGSSGVVNIFNAIMEYNYVNFFSSASRYFPDLQSIATHELGHLLGLDHSCGPLGAPNQFKANVACPDISSDPSNELFSTVMYPASYFDGSGQGEVKHDLSDNDQGRANCLY